MGIEKTAAPAVDRPWARRYPAIAVREVIISNVFGSIIDAWADYTVAGREHVERLPGAAVFVANHCSHVDTPALLRALPGPRRRRTGVVAAADYFYERRLLADVVSLSFCTVPVDRRAKVGVADGTAAVDRVLEEGWSLVVYPEGTRSRSGVIGPLRPGAALLAARHETPIVPVHISNTHLSMPPGSFWMVRPQGGRRFARYPIRVSFGEPFTVAPRDDLYEAMERVRLFMARCGGQTTPDPKLASRRAARARRLRSTAPSAGGVPAPAVPAR